MTRFMPVMMIFAVPTSLLPRNTASHPRVRMEADNPASMRNSRASITAENKVKGAGSLGNCGAKSLTPP